MPTDWYKARALFDFSWRASRREWLVIHVLGFIAIWLAVLPMVVLVPLTKPIGEPSPLLGLLYGLTSLAEAGAILAIFVAWLAVAVRRMHDQEKTGWLLLLNLVPLVGWIFSLIFIFTPGDEQANLYGPNPRFEPRPNGQTSSTNLP